MADFIIHLALSITVNRCLVVRNKYIYLLKGSFIVVFKENVGAVGILEVCTCL